MDAVIEKIPNHVKKLNDKTFDGWLSEKNETLKAVLFTEKGVTSPLIKSLAIDFLGKITFGQVRNSEKESAKSFGVTSFPTLVLLPGGDNEGFVYNGVMKKESISKFLGAFAPSNADSAAPAGECPFSGKNKKTQADKGDKDNVKKQKKDTKDKKASKEENRDAETSEDGKPKERVILDASDYSNLDPEEKKKFEDAHTRARFQQAKSVSKQPVEPIADEETLRQKCLSEKTKHCVLILLPAQSENTEKISIDLINGLKAFQEITEKHQKRDANLPTYIVRPELPFVALLRASLGLKSADHFEVIAVNGKRGWWTPYPDRNFNSVAVEAWLDTIRMNEVVKHKLPRPLLVSPDVIEAEQKKAEEERIEKERIAWEKAEKERKAKEEREKEPAAPKPASQKVEESAEVPKPTQTPEKKAEQEAEKAEESVKDEL